MGGHGVIFTTVVKQMLIHSMAVHHIYSYHVKLTYLQFAASVVNECNIAREKMFSYMMLVKF